MLDLFRPVVVLFVIDVLTVCVRVGGEKNKMEIDENCPN